MLTLHAETEGLAYRHRFRALLERHRALGIEHLTAAEYAAETWGRATAREVALGESPGAGRAG